MPAKYSITDMQRVARFLVEEADDLDVTTAELANEVAIILGEAIKAEAPGTLGEHLETWVKGNRVQFYLPKHAMFVWKGARPHVIEPKGNYPLHFFVASGDEVFTRRVNHPGIKPNPFIERAVADAAPQIEALYGVGIKRRMTRVK